MLWVGVFGTEYSQMCVRGSCLPSHSPLISKRYWCSFEAYYKTVVLTLPLLFTCTCPSLGDLSVASFAAALVVIFPLATIGVSWRAVLTLYTLSGHWLHLYANRSKTRIHAFGSYLHLCIHVHVSVWCILSIYAIVGNCRPKNGFSASRCPRMKKKNLTNRVYLAPDRQTHPSLEHA